MEALGTSALSPGTRHMRMGGLLLGSTLDVHCVSSSGGTDADLVVRRAGGRGRSARYDIQLSDPRGCSTAAELVMEVWHGT